jgi:succinyl-CoA synthetase beta subunit
MADPGRLLLKRLGVPGFDRVDLAARFLRALQDGGQVELVPDRQPAAGPIENLASGEDAIATLRQAGISFPARRLLAIDEAEQLAGSLPHVPEPWAVKIEVAGVAHKARLGGVILHEYPSPALVEKVDLALEKIRRQGLDPVSIVVEQFIANAVELFAAVLRDETFGLVALLGMGGTRVDYLPRPTLHLGIPTPADTLDLLRRSGVADELDTSPISAEAAARPLHDLFAALVEVMADPRLTSVELNPIVMTDTPPAVIALDAVVVKTSLRRDPNESEVAACSMPSM